MCARLRINIHDNKSKVTKAIIDLLNSLNSIANLQKNSKNNEMYNKGLIVQVHLIKDSKENILTTA